MSSPVFQAAWHPDLNPAREKHLFSRLTDPLSDLAFFLFRLIARTCIVPSSWMKVGRPIQGIEGYEVKEIPIRTPDGANLTVHFYRCRVFPQMERRSFTPFRMQ